MEKRSRYCPFCGNKTNDSHCEICGKTTRPIAMSDKEKELDIIKDDTYDTSAQNLRHDHIDETYHAGKKKAKLKFQDGHPYFDIGKNAAGIKVDPKLIRKLISLIPFAVVIIIIVFSFVTSFEKEEAPFELNIESPNEWENTHTSYFEYVDYEFNKSSNATCEVSKSLNDTTVIITNPSDYFLDNDIILSNGETYYNTMQQPHSQKNFEFFGTQIDSCRIDNETVSSFAFHKPKIRYHIEEVGVLCNIYIDEASVNKEDFSDLMMYISAGYEMQNDLDFYQFHIYVDNQQAYDMEAYSVDGEITLSFQSQNKAFEEMESFVFTGDDNNQLAITLAFLQ